MPTRESLVAFAASFDGTTEDPPKSNLISFNDWFYGRREKAPWCCTYLSFCCYEQGVRIGPGRKGGAYTPDVAAWAKREGIWVPWDAPIEPGWLVFYYFPSQGRIAHCGITSTGGTGTFRAWEGNTDEKGGRTGGRVLHQTRSRTTVGREGGFVNLNRYFTGEGEEQEMGGSFFFSVEPGEENQQVFRLPPIDPKSGAGLLGHRAGWVALVGMNPNTEVWFVVSGPNQTDQGGSMTIGDREEVALPIRKGDNFVHVVNRGSAPIGGCIEMR